MHQKRIYGIRFLLWEEGSVGKNVFYKVFLFSSSCSFKLASGIILFANCNSSDEVKMSICQEVQLNFKRN
jgi:hypothetical protein